jgi:hypothetical protein
MYTLVVHFIKIFRPNYLINDYGNKTLNMLYIVVKRKTYSFISAIISMFESLIHIFLYIYNFCKIVQAIKGHIDWLNL